MIKNSEDHLCKLMFRTCCIDMQTCKPTVAEKVMIWYYGLFAFHFLHSITLGHRKITVTLHIAIQFLITSQCDLILMFLNFTFCLSKLVKRANFDDQCILPCKVLW